jgi:hypothetical protein
LDPGPSIGTIRSLADRWIAWKREERKGNDKDVKGHQRLLDRWVLPHAIADYDLEHELDVGICTEWIEWVKKFGLR